MRRHEGSKYTNAAKSARSARASAHVITYNHCANRNQAGNPDTCPPPTRRRPDAVKNQTSKAILSIRRAHTNPMYLKSGRRPAVSQKSCVVVKKPARCWRAQRQLESLCGCAR